jgi:ABC-type oligopeptide transport system ATPase subunit
MYCSYYADNINKKKLHTYSSLLLKIIIKKNQANIKKGYRILRTQEDSKKTAKITIFKTLLRMKIRLLN